MNDEQGSPADLAGQTHAENGRDIYGWPARRDSEGTDPLETANGNHPISSEPGLPFEAAALPPEYLPAPPPAGRAAVNVLGTIREIVETVALALLFFLAVRAVVQNFRVEGSSMYSSFIDGQYVLVNKGVYARVDNQTVAKWLPFIHSSKIGERYVFHAPRRGDVVVFHPPPPNDPSRDFIKRVIGVPGDTVEVRQGKVFVNGGLVSQPFITQATLPLNPRYTKVTLGKDQFYVMGDNRGNSSDSRAWGPVSAGEMVGRAWLVYWPLQAWRVAPNHAEVVPAAAAPR